MQLFFFFHYDILVLMIHIQLDNLQRILFFKSIVRKQMKLHNQWISPIKLKTIFLPMVLFAAMSSNLLHTIYTDTTI